MFPIRDHNPSDRLPFINYIIIAVTSFIFYLEITAPDFERFLGQYALIPSQVDFTNPGTLYPFVTSIFLHGGWLHIISNMWFLLIFGDNIEAFLGHIRYLVFYLFCGIGAGLVQYFFTTGLDIPTLGASGAIAGIMGAYIHLFPKNRIDTFIISFFGFLQVIQLPAYIMLGYWFLIQFLSGVGSTAGPAEGGVAYWAHIGGFAIGWFFIRLFGKSGEY